MSTDSVTVLQCAPQLRLAKLLKADGTFLDYDSPKRFSAAEHPVSSLSGLYRGLQALQHQPDQCIVRGALINGPTAKNIRRLLHRDPETGDEPTLCEVPRWWVALDMDGHARPEGVKAADLLGCARAVIPALPSAFHGASCIVQATAGHGRKPGSRLRLWYWLNRAVSRVELEIWFAGHQVDPVSFRPVQITYTAAPMFEAGVLDHLPHRLAMLEGAGDVTVPPRGALEPPVRLQKSLASMSAVAAADWVERVFERGIGAVATASDGNRHATCVKVAFCLASYVHEGRLDESCVRAALADALARSGKTETEAHSIFGWAMSQAAGAVA